jgi:heptosyltransferase-2
MSLGALRSLRRAYPDSRLTVLAKPWVEELYEACDGVDAILRYDPRKDGGIRGLLRTARRLREAKFDAAVLLPNSFRSAAIVWAAGIPERWGYAEDGRGLLLTRGVPPAHRPFGRHQAYYYLDLLRHLGVETGQPDTHLSLTDTMRGRATELLQAHRGRPGQALVGIHPGATNSSAKRWIPERYAEVAERLAASHDARIVVLGGPEEEVLAEEIRAHLETPSLSLAGQTSLGELMGILGSLSILISNDSGPMHLAAALGTPTVAVFGPTDERETGPLSRKARVVRHHVECSPCLLKQCPIDHRCMERVTVEDVYSASVDLLEGSGSRERAEAASR